MQLIGYYTESEKQIVSAPVVHPYDSVADWECSHCCRPAYEGVSYYTYVAIPGKDQNSKYIFY